MTTFPPSLLAPRHRLWRSFGRSLVTLLAGAASLAFAATASAAAVSITTKTIPVAVTGTAYSVTLAASGGTSPYTWKMTSGGFPDGLSLSAAGLISGTPAPSGSWEYSYPFNVYVTVTDAKGGSASKTFQIPLQAPAATKYTLTVVSGTGGGSFAAGTTETITANAPAAGKTFKSWTGATVANATASTTTLVMPSGNITVTATYTDTAPPPPSQYTLTVVNGSGGGSYVAGANVTITANAAPSGQVFQNWTGATVASTTASTTTLVMPAAPATVTANYASVTPPPPPPPPAAPLAITAATLPAATVGTAYAQTLTATGGKTPYTWELVSGAFPDGLAIDAAGNITGSPANEGSWIYSYPFMVYVSVTDSANATTAMAFTVNALPPAGGTGTGSTGSGTTGTGSTGGGSNPPPATTYNVTVTNGTVNGSATGAFAAGTTVTLVASAAPTGEYFQQWTGNATEANPLASTTTFTMPSNDVALSATFYTPAPIPQPVTTHPRLWITPSDLPKYQSWATASNPIYQQGLLPLLNQAIANYNQCFPNGQPNPVYPDLGDTQGYQGVISEQNALIFALFSMIDPDPAARILHAQRARNLIMYALNIAAQGPLSNAPFRDPLFPVYNRANATSEAWPLVVDWIYNAKDAQGNLILTAADKATIRTVFLQWSTTCLNAYTTGGDHPSPVGVMNSVSLLPGGDAYRMASNNYYLGHARLLTLMSLALDPADDPAVDPTVPDAVLGNTMRSYIANATGAWLYQQYAMLGDPAAVRSAYNLSATASVGLASGGLPPEGMLYGHSYSFILGQLLALKTAGFADPALSGPQVSLANDPALWDRFMKGMASSLVPAAQVYPGYEYMGPVYELASYGDILRMWITPDFAQPFALLSLLDQKNGDLSRQNDERWWVINALEGGSANLINRVSSPWSYGVQDALLTFLLLDPTAAPATDPRPNYPTAFYDASQGRLVEHSNWTANAAMFDFRCSWISINHQQADANQFEFYRKGEWLTKGVANYDNNSLGLTTEYHNTLSLQNLCAAGTPANLGWWEGPFWADGSQWQLGGSAGDPTATVSVQATYTYAFGDTTNLYNRPSPWTPANAALDILHASRSILWLKPDHIVVYDRATSQTAGLFKRFNLALTAAPTIANGIVATTTPGGQHLYLSTLLPAGATVTSSVVGPELNPIAELEPTVSRIVIENPATSTDVRFLHVLQGADASQAADPTALVQSTAGTTFDGALVLDNVVMFKHDVAAAFTGVTYAVPATTAHDYVTGLTPGAAYTVTVTSDGTTAQVVIAAGGSLTADSAGVLAFDLSAVLH